MVVGTPPRDPRTSTGKSRLAVRSAAKRGDDLLLVGVWVVVIALVADVVVRAGAGCGVAHSSWPAQTGLMPSVLNRVILVRHGETEWNRVRRRQGQLNSPLTADGRRHAKVAANLCVGLGVDGIFSSPLGRAQQTAAIVSSVLHSPVEVIDDLAEVHHGVIAGLTNAEIEDLHPGELGRREMNKYTWVFPGGESYADAGVRAIRALEEIAATGVNSPLLVTHEMMGRMLLRSLLDLDVDDALSLSMTHGTAFEVWPDESRVKRHSPRASSQTQTREDGTHTDATP